MRHLLVVCNDLRVRHSDTGLNCAITAVPVCSARACANLPWNKHAFVLPRFAPRIILPARAVISPVRASGLALSRILCLATSLASSWILCLARILALIRDLASATICR
jgi:hypothetical protein